MLQIAAAYAINQASNKGGSGSSSSGSASDSDGTSIKVTQAVIDLADQCGAELPKTKDALMLMIKSCQTS
jgi:hypothetical protein